MTTLLLSQDSEVEEFKTLLRFRTVSAEGPISGAYKECAQWLVTKCEELGFSCKVVEPVAGKPVVVATLKGSEPDLPSIVLNSHYDVVPAMEDEWHTDPFAAEEIDGKIYGRGTQDMKCVCMQYIHALRRIIIASSSPACFRRTLHLVYVPDEEIGGKDGMKAFIDAGMFESMLAPVALVLDEGLASPTETYTVFNGERAPFWIIVKARGPTGHGSRFIADTAVSKLLEVANHAMEFRRAEESKLGYQKEGGCKHCEAKKLGDVTTVNLTMLRAGVSLDEGKTFSLNVIPTLAEAGFDVRVCPQFDMKEFEGMLDTWTRTEGLSWEYASWTSPIKEHKTTSVERVANPWWGVFSDAAAACGMTVQSEIFPAATDSRFLRANGVKAFGFSPMARTPVLLHEHNEYLERHVYIEGISKYETIIAALANADPTVDEC